MPRNATTDDLAALELRLSSRISALEGRVGSVETRTTAVEQRVSAVQADTSGFVDALATFDTRLKLLSKWDPKRYGDKVSHVGGDDDDAPIKHAISVKFV